MTTTTKIVNDVGYTATLIALDCGTCGIPFGMPENLYAEAKRDGRWFYCPNGDTIHFYQTENQKLREELDREKRLRSNRETLLTQTRDQLQAAENSRRALKGVVTRTKRRGAASLCPVEGCKRSFVDVRRHLENKHPGYVEDHNHA